MKGIRTAKQMMQIAVGKLKMIYVKARYLGRAFIDEFKLPKEIAKLKSY